MVKNIKFVSAVILASILILSSLPTPQAAQAAPTGGYTCLPSCSETDGRFLSLPGEHMASFGDSKLVAWIAVPAGESAFELGIFDGDSGKDNAGNVNVPEGNWDNASTESSYVLYADPLKDGQGSTVVGTWHGNQDPMPNNDWFNITLNTGAEARAPSGHYFYRLEVTRPAAGGGINAFKLRSNAFLSTGRADLVDANFGIVGMLATYNDFLILYPEFDGDWNNPGPSTYSGDWQFYFYLDDQVATLELWDGDFDHGSSNGSDPDTDDPDTVGKPDWAGMYAVDEGARGKGIPADDFGNPIYKRSPAVQYQLTDPAGATYLNPNPSGTEEWERFALSVDPNVPADYHVSSIPAGWYDWQIAGLDLHNTVWIRTHYEIASVTFDGLPVLDGQPPVWPTPGTTDPRTIGYWKNNVKKILIQGKTNGVQETYESLVAGLNAIALLSPLFRSGIDVNNPAPIADPVRLADQEAHAILQKSNGNSMLDRALQQNLAAWFNLGTGKLDPDLYIYLNWGGGSFEGTVWEALQEAQDLILNGGDLERAKDIADQINNGNLGN